VCVYVYVYINGFPVLFIMRTNKKERTRSSYVVFGLSKDPVHVCYWFVYS